MKLPKDFVETPFWFMVELSQFCHDDINMPERKGSMFRIFPDYDQAMEAIENAKDAYGHFHVNVFVYERPSFKNEELPTREEIKSKGSWEYRIDNGWAAITHLDMLETLNERLWHFLTSNDKVEI